MYVETGPDAQRPEGDGEDLYMHVGVSYYAHRPEWTGGDPYMHVRAGPNDHKPKGAGGDRTCTWEPVLTPTGPRGPVRTVHARGMRSGRPQALGDRLGPYMHVGAGPDAHRP